MFCRFQGVAFKKSNSHMRCFVMQNAKPLFGFSRSITAAASAVLMTVAASASYAAGTPREAGVWIDETGKGAVKIEPCGERLCGRIVWLKDLVNDQGEVLTDKHNPDPAQRSRTICGLPVLGQLQAMPEGGYDGGWVYDPKVGKSYSVAIVLSGPDALTVTGYKGVKLLGKSFGWTRAKMELPSCAPEPQKSGAAKPASPSSNAAKAAAAAPAAVKPKTADSKPQPAKSAVIQADNAGTASAKPAAQKKASVPAAAKSKTAADAGETLPWAKGGAGQ